MGPLIPNAARGQQQHQDGGRHRGLLAHRVRVQQVEVRLLENYYPCPPFRQDIFPNIVVNFFLRRCLHLITLVEGYRPLVTAPFAL